MLAPYKIEDLACYFCSQTNIIAAYIFGSFAEGVETIKSDVDIALLLDHTHNNIFDYRLELMDALSVMLERETDVVILNDVPVLLQFQVIKKGKLIFERNADKRAQFQMRVMGRYYDYEKFFKFQSRHLLSRLKGGMLGVRFNSNNFKT